MAVFTKLLKEDIENFISEYSIGNLDSFEEIVDGIENSNFKNEMDGKSQTYSISLSHTDTRGSCLTVVCT